jgi:cytidine deaminase
VENGKKIMTEYHKNELKQLAKTASAGAYSPYSKFCVGAVVADSDGALHVGCNVENASYGLTSCAERNALAAAMAAGKRELAAILIYVPGKRVFEPCGACRQVMLELMPGSAPVFSLCDVAEKRWTVAELLPDGFVFHVDY